MARWKEESLRDRFERNYTPVPFSGCLLWLASENKFGYGQIWDKEAGRAIAAHRVSYRLFIGEIPAGRQVLHKCDVPSCVNPDHLFLGNAQDNLLDMTTKGRGRKSAKGLPPGIYCRKPYAASGRPLYYASISIDGTRIRSQGYGSIEEAEAFLATVRWAGRSRLEADRA